MNDAFRIQRKRAFLARKKTFINHNSTATPPIIRFSLPSLCLTNVPRSLKGNDYSQLCRKRPPLVHDKVVAYLREVAVYGKNQTAIICQQVWTFLTFEQWFFTITRDHAGWSLTGNRKQKNMSNFWPKKWSRSLIISEQWSLITREFLKQYLSDKQNGCLLSGRLREVVAMRELTVLSYSHEESTRMKRFKSGWPTSGSLAW